MLMSETPPLMMKLKATVMASFSRSVRSSHSVKRVVVVEGEGEEEGMHSPPSSAPMIDWYDGDSTRNKMTYSAVHATQ
ncbi:hypothetical protein NFJ02_24g54130 [Pycnococcus provasolii]